MAETNPLHGQFSGLWSCDLCGYSGFLCRCEHYSRGGNVWGHHGRVFSDAELAAEYYRLLIGHHLTGREDFKTQAATILRFTENPSYEELDTDNKEP